MRRLHGRGGRDRREAGRSGPRSRLHPEPYGRYLEVLGGEARALGATVAGIPFFAYVLRGQWPAVAAVIQRSTRR